MTTGPPNGSALAAVADADEVERPQIREHQEHRDEETEVADAVDDERLLARVGVRLLAEPEADEQIRTETDAFPPDEQQRIVAAEHEQQHEEDEQVQIREVARIAWIVLHVADAEQMDQHADAGDDERHHHRELIELERGVDLEIADRHPREVPLDERRGASRPAPRMAKKIAAVSRNESTSTPGPTMLVIPANLMADDGVMHRVVVARSSCASCVVRADSAP